MIQQRGTAGCISTWRFPFDFPKPLATLEKREYTGLGELCWLYRDGVAATYKYRPDGLRFSKTIASRNGETATTVHHWNGQSMVLETTGAGLVKSRFLRGVGLIAQQIGGELHWYLHNAHGDVVQQADSNQVLLSDYETDAFGVEREPNPLDPNPMRYCGEYVDSESGQVYLRNRYYDPVTGRFTSEDPVRSGGNWYAYCGGNPLSFVDPMGLAARSTGRPWVDRALNGRSPEEGLSWGVYERIYNSGMSSKQARNDARTLDVYDQWRSGRSSSRASSDTRAFVDWAGSDRTLTYSVMDPYAAPARTGGNAIATVQGALSGIQLLDGVLPFADAAYLIALLVAAGIDYGPYLADWVGNYGPQAWENIKQRLSGGSSNATPPDPNNWNQRDVLLEGVKNPKLRNAISELYRAKASIGDGGTADALRYEFDNGLTLQHLQKAQNMITHLNNILTEGQLSESEIKLTYQLLNDLHSAVKYVSPR